MKYLLDTNVIVDHLRGKKPIEASLVKKGSLMSIITQAELYYGAYKSKKPQENLRKIRQMLEDLAIDTVNLSKDIIDVYGQIKAKLEAKGQKLDEFDLLIAATALSSDLTLVTRNTSHFRRIPHLSFRT